jgi:serpin B
MKQNIFLIFSFLVLLVSCSESKQEEISFKKTATSSKIISSNNDFAFSFFREIASEQEDNYMVSPVSLSLAMGMLFNGTQGITTEMMSEGLGYANFNTENLSEINKNIIDNLTSENFKIANSNWIKQGFDVKQDFIDLNKKYYYAEVKTEDFNNPNTVDKINNWASNQTNQKIKTIIDEISNDAVLFLINAIYFKADWKLEFEEKNTTKQLFYPETENGELVDMMHLETDKLFYQKNDLFSSVILPYKNDKYSMTVLLPNEDKSTNDIVEKLNSNTWENWQNNYETTDVRLSLPKFKFEYKNSLNDELSNLGFGDLFGTPNLLGISDDNLTVSKVLQKTFIDVNEKGTEAAAVTVIGIEVTSLPLVSEINCNKPFLFLITEKNTGSICFIGKVGKPEYSK